MGESHSSESSLSSLDVTLFFEHRGNNEAKFVLHHCLKYYVKKFHYLVWKLPFFYLGLVFYFTQHTYIKVDHDELGEFVPEGFRLS